MTGERDVRDQTAPSASWSASLQPIFPASFFGKKSERNKSPPTENKTFFFARMIPYRGAWVEFEYDIEQRSFCPTRQVTKSCSATVLLRALGLESDEDILRVFYDNEPISVDGSDRKSP